MNLPAMLKTITGHLNQLALVLLVLFAAPRAWAQGPPYQTDDPVPVDLHHYEFYIFGGVDGTPAEIDSTGPAFEFNWGAIPRVQVHAILPWGVHLPFQQSCLLSRRHGAQRFRTHRHGTGREDRFHQGVEARSADR